MRMTIFKNKLITLKIDKDMYKGNLLDIALGSIKLVQTLENKRQYLVNDIYVL